GDELLAASVRFGRELRRAGLAIDLGAAIDFARALGLVDIGQRDEARAAGATVFVRRRDDLPPAAPAFDRFWRRPGPRRESARRAGLARSPCCATSAARWSPPLACCCAASRRWPRPTPSAPRRSCSGRGSRASPACCVTATVIALSRGSPTRSRTGLEGPGSA